jgi:hypothetical protein
LCCVCWFSFFLFLFFLTTKDLNLQGPEGAISMATSVDQGTLQAFVDARDDRLRLTRENSFGIDLTGASEVKNNPRYSASSDDDGERNARLQVVSENDDFEQSKLLEEASSSVDDEMDPKEEKNETKDDLLDSKELSSQINYRSLLPLCFAQFCESWNSDSIFAYVTFLVVDFGKNSEVVFFKFVFLKFIVFEFVSSFSLQRCDADKRRSRSVRWFGCGMLFLWQLFVELFLGLFERQIWAQKTVNRRRSGDVRVDCVGGV